MNPPLAMTLTPTARRPDPFLRIAPGHQLRLGNAIARLDQGGILVAQWPDVQALAARVEALGNLESPVVRLAGGALIGDLSLQDNLMLEPALADGVLPAGLLPRSTHSSHGPAALSTGPAGPRRCRSKQRRWPSCRCAWAGPWWQTPTCC